MTQTRYVELQRGLIAAVALFAVGAPGRALAAPLAVCATVPELGSLVREIGGAQVEVTVFAKPTEDPHFVEARPSFVKQLSQADVFVQIGLELEVGWAPALLQQANNPRVLPGHPGYVDTSVAVTPIDVPSVAVDRSMGDVHPLGNPHYLSDPLNGLRVAALLRDRLGALRLDQRDYFQDRYAAFAARLGAALVGEPLAQKYDVQKLALLFEAGKLGDFLQRQGEAPLLGGWLGLMLPWHGSKVVDDHNMWPYFAQRFGLVVIGHLEPKPGVPPTTRHLKELVELMQAEKVKAVLASAYYDQRHADFVARATGAQVVRIANQAGARPGTEEYLAMIDYNVRAVAAALGGRA